MMVAGPTGSGKTRLLVDLISQASEIADVPPSDIIYCFSKWQSIYDVLEEKYNVKFYKGLPDEEIIPSDGKNRWLIIDDLMSEVQRNEGQRILLELFTRGSHHDNISVIYVTQNYFDSPRSITLNSQYLFLGRNPRDKLTPMNIAKQMFPGRVKDFVRVYEEATSEPYSFLFVSFRQETPDALRLLSNFGRPGKPIEVFMISKK
jgi:hypothetical protein